MNPPIKTQLRRSFGYLEGVARPESWTDIDDRENEKIWIQS